MRTALVLALLTVAPGLHAQAADLKVGFTNIELMLNYMPEIEQINQELKAHEEKLSQELEIRQGYYRSELQTYMGHKQADGLTPQEDAAWVKKLGGLEQEIKRKTKAAEQSLSQKQMQLMAPMMERMQKAIDSVANEQGYDYIINQTSGGGMPSILYGDPSVDITTPLAKKLGVKGLLDAAE